ncbi:MAG: HisA/HisF-related TIM barrel protein, partial [Acidobacteriota bacterium]
AEAGRLASALGPARCVAALDVLRGRVKVSGWRADAGAGLGEAMAMAAETGYGEVLVTDIERDGVMAGPNLELYGELPEGAACIASGGVRSATDLRALASLPGVAGAVVGRALYEGTVRPSELAEYRA